MYRLKELRMARGLSTRALANATGLSHTTIARIEKGERKLSTPQAVAIGSFFHVSADYLLGKSAQEMFDDFVSSMRSDFSEESLYLDGDVTQSLSSAVGEPLRTKLEIIFLLQDINSAESLEMLYNLAKLRSAAEDFGGELK